MVTDVVKVLKIKLHILKNLIQFRLLLLQLCDIRNESLTLSFRLEIPTNLILRRQATHVEGFLLLVLLLGILNDQALLQNGGLVVLFQMGKEVQLGVHSIAAYFTAIQGRGCHILDMLVLVVQFGVYVALELPRNAFLVGQHLAGVRAGGVVVRIEEILVLV